MIRGLLFHASVEIMLAFFDKMSTISLIIKRLFLMDNIVPSGITTNFYSLILALKPF